MPIVCRGGSKANPTHPSSSWFAHHHGLLLVESLFLWLVGIFFLRFVFCVKMAIIYKRNRTNGYKFYQISFLGQLKASKTIHFFEMSFFGKNFGSKKKNWSTMHFFVSPILSILCKLCLKNPFFASNIFRWSCSFMTCNCPWRDGGNNY